MSRYSRVRYVVTSLTLSEARAHLPALIDRVETGEEVVITRHGRPVAVMVRPEALRVRRSDHALEMAEQLREALDEARSKLIPTDGLSIERAEELVTDVRRGRSEA